MNYLFIFSFSFFLFFSRGFLLRLKNNKYLLPLGIQEQW